VTARRFGDAMVPHLSSLTAEALMASLSDPASGALGVANEALETALLDGMLEPMHPEAARIP
jgi:hypothetical protein